MKGMIKHFQICLSVLLLAESLTVSAKTWTLEECISYAMENNITLQKAGLKRQTNMESVLSSK